jgi:alkyl hydroperoxide reductase subunit AhpC
MGSFQLEDLQISVKYEHNIVYGIVDLPHDVRNSYIIDNNGRDQSIIMPVQAIGRRFHYLIDSQNYEGDNLYDNSLIKA